MATKLLIYVAIGDEDKAEAFTSFENQARLAQEFDFVAASEVTNLEDMEHRDNVHISHLIKSTIANHINRKRNAAYFKEQFGDNPPQSEPPEHV